MIIFRRVLISLLQLLINPINALTIDFSTQQFPTAQFTNDLITQYPTEQYTGKVERCRRSIKGCRCEDEWQYQGQTYQACANPDLDERGNWCLVKQGCINEDLIGLVTLLDESFSRYDYCPTFCLDLPYNRKQQQQLLTDCEVSNKGCACLNGWSYGNEENITGCANPDNDTWGSWCLVDPATCAPNTFTGEIIYPSGQIQNYDYCPTACEILRSPNLKSNETILENTIKIRAEDDKNYVRAFPPEFEDQEGDLDDFLSSGVVQFVPESENFQKPTFVSIQIPDLNEIQDLDEEMLALENFTFFGFQIGSEPGVELIQINLFDPDSVKEIFENLENDSSFGAESIQNVLLAMENLDKFEELDPPFVEAEDGYDIDELPITVASPEELTAAIEILGTRSGVPEADQFPLDQFEIIYTNQSEPVVREPSKIKAEEEKPIESEIFSQVPEVDQFPVDQYGMDERDSIFTGPPIIEGIQPEEENVQFLPEDLQSIPEVEQLDYFEIIYLPEQKNQQQAENDIIQKTIFESPKVEEFESVQQFVPAAEIFEENDLFQKGIFESPKLGNFESGQQLVPVDEIFEQLELEKELIQTEAEFQIPEQEIVLHDTDYFSLDEYEIIYEGDKNTSTIQLDLKSPEIEFDPSRPLLDLFPSIQPVAEFDRILPISYDDNFSIEKNELTPELEGSISKPMQPQRSYEEISDLEEHVAQFSNFFRLSNFTQCLLQKQFKLFQILNP
eukprot:TRINITY_DN38527_c1_g2_i1.p1 TRINITY_DN38527_c1_g2~~TRINITY_DN38527_c1_g2_i1.p1  ORF type:complete len:763 (-),score=130.35 TRINITY_DN38527_c1_g2_i1:101-2296(-)